MGIIFKLFLLAIVGLIILGVIYIVGFDIPAITETIIKIIDVNKEIK